MKKRMNLNTILMILFAVIVIGGGIVCTEIEVARERERTWIGSYPMANANISWSGAGYNGYWGDR